MTSVVLQGSTYLLLPEFFRIRDESVKGWLKIFWEAVDAELDEWDAGTLAKIADSRNVDIATERQLDVLAYELGVGQPKAKAQYFRRFIRNVSTYISWKGNYDQLAAAIFVATGLATTVIVPYHRQQLAFTVSHSKVGVSDPVGMNYKSEPLDRFKVGYTPVATGIIGSQSVNPYAPYELRITFTLIPTAEQLLVVDWVVNLIKRAIDIPVYVIPTTSTLWTVGVSRVGIDTVVGFDCFKVGTSPVSGAKICGPPSAILRIIQADGTPVVDT